MAYITSSTFPKAWRELVQSEYLYQVHTTTPAVQPRQGMLFSQPTARFGYAISTDLVLPPPSSRGEDVSIIQIWRVSLPSQSILYRNGVLRTSHFLFQHELSDEEYLDILMKVAPTPERAQYAPLVSRIPIELTETLLFVFPDFLGVLSRDFFTRDFIQRFLRRSPERNRCLNTLFSAFPDHVSGWIEPETVAMVLQSNENDPTFHLSTLIYPYDSEEIHQLAFHRNPTYYLHFMASQPKLMRFKMTRDLFTFAVRFDPANLQWLPFIGLAKPYPLIWAEIAAVESKGMYLPTIHAIWGIEDSISIDLYRKAVQAHGEALQHIPSSRITIDVICFAVEQTFSAIQWIRAEWWEFYQVSLIDELMDRVPECYPALPASIKEKYDLTFWDCIRRWAFDTPAITGGGLLRRFIPLFFQTKEKMERLQEDWIIQMLECDGALMQYLPTRYQISDLHCRTAVQNSGLALQFVRNPSEELEQIAVERHPSALRWVERPSFATIQRAVSGSYRALCFCPRALTSSELYTLVRAYPRILECSVVSEWIREHHSGWVYYPLKTLGRWWN